MVADVARRTAVLRGRTTADETDAVAERLPKTTHALVREGISGRVINRSRRRRTRNIGKPCKIGLQAPRFLRSDPAKLTGGAHRAGLPVAYADGATNLPARGLGALIAAL